MALNLQTNDLPTQLHHALYATTSYVLKPPELRDPGGVGWPAPRSTTTCVTLKVPSLHHLPSYKEGRPRLLQGRRKEAHTMVASLSGVPSPPETSSTVSSPHVKIELFAIGGVARM